MLGGGPKLAHTRDTLGTLSRRFVACFDDRIESGWWVGVPRHTIAICAISVSVEAQSAWETDDSSLDDDETVALERADCLAVELPRVARACCDEA